MGNCKKVLLASLLMVTPLVACGKPEESVSPEESTSNNESSSSSQTNDSASDSSVSVENSESVSESSLVSESASEEAKVLESVAVDASNVKKTYNINEEISYEGLKLNLVYNSSNEVLDDLSNCEIVLKDSDGNVVSALGNYGNYTVSVSYEGKSDSYQVEVVALDSVKKAIAVGKANASSVVSGTKTAGDLYPGQEEASESKVEYAFGDNYLRLFQYGGYEHYEMINGKISETTTSTLDDDAEIYVDSPYGASEDQDYLKGARFDVFDYAYSYYGVEDLVEGLYQVGKYTPNMDFAEVLPSALSSKYEFSYSIVIESYGQYNYFLVDVAFELGTKNAFTNVEVEVVKYDRETFAMSMAKDEYDEEIGYAAKLNEGAEWSITSYYKAVQEEGERDLVNNFSKTQFLVKSFDLVNTKDSTDKLVNNQTLDLVAGQNGMMRYDILSPQPENANFSMDPIYFSCPDYDNGQKTTWLYDDYETGLIVTYASSSNQIWIRGENAGTFELTISTTYVEYKLTLNITYPAPTEIFPQVYIPNVDPSKAGFVDTTETSIYVDSPLYVTSKPTDKGDPAFTASMQTENANASFVEEEINGVKVYKFVATEAGEYVISFAAVKDPSVTSSMTVTVNEVPAISDLLNGLYSFVSTYGGDSSVVFTPSNDSCGEMVVNVAGQTETFTYEYVNKKVNLVYTGSNQNVTASLVINDMYQLVFSYSFGDYAESNIILGAEKEYDDNGMKLSWYGTFVSADGKNTIVVDQNGINLNGNQLTIKAVSGNSITTSGFPFVMSDDGNTISNSMFGLSCSRVEEEKEYDGNGMKLAWYGTFVSADGKNTIIVDENGIKLNGNQLSIVSVAGNSITTSGFPFVMSDDGNTISNNMFGISCVREGAGGEGGDTETAIPSAWIGSYADSTGYVMVEIGENFVKVDGSDVTVLSVDETNNTITFEDMFGTDVITVTPGVSVNYYGDDFALTKEEVSLIPSTWVGLYGDESGYIVVEIGSDFVKVDGELVTIVSVDKANHIITYEDMFGTDTITVNPGESVVYGEDTFALQDVKVESLIPSTWVGGYGDETGYVVVEIGADYVRIDGGSVTVISVDTARNTIVYEDMFGQDTLIVSPGVSVTMGENVFTLVTE